MTMKINVGKLAKTVVTKAKENPEATLAIFAAIAPGLVRKALPKAIPVIVAIAGKK